MGFFDRFLRSNAPAPASGMISGNADPQIQQAILANIQAIGLENFPDDEAAVWHVDRIEHTMNGMLLVETSPVPHVGYARIRFHLVNTSVQGVVAADYWDNGQWSGLFSA
ncbi:MAG: hypothetical protein ACPGOT_02105 [Candidatus Poseidoniaceae archaeon]